MPLILNILLNDYTPWILLERLLIFISESLCIIFSFFGDDSGIFPKMSDFCWEQIVSSLLFGEVTHLLDELINFVDFGSEATFATWAAKLAATILASRA